MNNWMPTCGIELCIRCAESSIYPLCELLYGRSDYLEKIYLSYPQSTTPRPFTVELYYFNGNLNYDEIAVKLLYGRRRSSDDSTWTITTPSDPVSSLPVDKTNVTLASIMQKVTEAKSAETDADGNTIVNTSTKQTITGKKLYTVFPAATLIPAWDITEPPSTTRYAQLCIWQDENDKKIGQVEAYFGSNGDRACYFMIANADGSGWGGRLGLVRKGDGTQETLCPSPVSDSDGDVIATTKWVNDKGYLTAIPVASQTVLGGVKAYTDSEGYFCIDTQ